jgi:hypothetical protein
MLDTATSTSRTGAGNTVLGGATSRQSAEWGDRSAPSVTLRPPAPTTVRLGRR